jgi:DNA-directed RNA polymerase subunit RPC12/RpoP
MPESSAEHRADDEPLFSPGVERTTQSAGQSIEDGKGRIFPCDQCGADLEFAIGQQSLQCPYCGSLKQIVWDDAWELVEHDYLAMLARLEDLRTHQRGDHKATGAHEVRCESCGANVVFQGTLTSTTCPYCGSPLQRDDVHECRERIPVDGVLPFQVTREQAAENLRQWVRSRWFAPNEFLRQGARGKFNGCYFPYFTFDSVTFTRYAGQRGDYYYVTVKQGNQTVTQRRTRWTPASGAFERLFDDVLVMVAQDENAALLRELEPWPLGKCRRFTPEALAGLFARTYDVPLDQGFEHARARMEQAIEAEVRRRIGGNEQRITSRKTSHSAITFKHLLLPVWLLVYRYRDRPYRVTVNAATGEVHGERPYSWVKITAFTLFCASVIGGIILIIQSQH